MWSSAQNESEGRLHRLRPDRALRLRRLGKLGSRTLPRPARLPYGACRSAGRRCSWPQAIFDSAYTSPRAIWQHVMGKNLHLPVSAATVIADLLCQKD